MAQITKVVQGTMEVRKAAVEVKSLALAVTDLAQAATSQRDQVQTQAARRAGVAQTPRVQKAHQAQVAPTLT